MFNEQTKSIQFNNIGNLILKPKPIGMGESRCVYETFNAPVVVKESRDVTTYGYAKGNFQSMTECTIYTQTKGFNGLLADIVDCLDIKAQRYLVMELLHPLPDDKYNSIFEYFREKGFDQEYYNQQLKALCQVTNLVQGDLLSPSNWGTDFIGRPKLLDYGFTKEYIHKFP